MAENKEYFTQEMENGSIQISEDVVASVTGMAVLEVEGVCGLSSSIGTDIAEMLGMKTLSKGVRLSTTETGALRIDCDVVSKFGQNIFELAKNVQENVKSSVESVTGLRVAEVNVTVCGIALPKDSKK
ncbi:MAG: Asp23/Gls24 family envelope stress response protein [Clostridiales bacterium]|nr:Asp23/Gls24 family envelope stress response protein [Clostridiales bacterium]MDD6064039.1 Asp23/Gls24 family envelope stress response protein [Clostridiales bacterium]